jgi:NADPH2:quinone reductase
VGSIAIDMLSARGYEVIAVSGKAESVEYLKSLGASQVLLRGDFQLGSKPLEPTRYAGAIDSVGGEVLAGLTRQVDFWGNIASVGLAGGAELKTTVLPFILRGVNLLGINSSATPRDERLEVWRRIVSDLTPRHLERIAQRTIAFAELPGAFQAYIDGKVTGRTVVKIGSQP